jgi:predicted lipid carrier protein YhbT
MLHLLAANYDWHHTITPTSEEIKVFATIFPMVSFEFPANRLLVILTNNFEQDDLFLSFTRREPTAAA